MTVSIPQEFEVQLQAVADHRNLSLDALVREIFHQYLNSDAALLDEFAAWEQVSDESLELVDKLIQSEQ